MNKLTEAVKRNDMAKVTRLLIGEYRSRVNEADAKDWTALQLAAGYGCVAIVSALLRAKARVDQAQNDGTTPLFMASQEGHVEVVEALLSAGANLEQADNDGTTPLFMASQNGHIEVVKALVREGARVDQAWNNGATPLFMASQNGHVHVVNALVRAGARVDQAANNGATPLFIASQNGHVEVVRTLLALGADSTHRTSFGTALEIAQRKNHTAVVEILRQPPPRRVVQPANEVLPHAAAVMLPLPSAPSSADNFSQRLREVNRYLASHYQRPVDANFFHTLTREQAESLLTMVHPLMVSGVFLLRSSSQAGAVALSYREGSGVGHSVLELLENGWIRYQGQAYALADYFSSVSHALTAPLSVADVAAMTSGGRPRYGAVGGVGRAAAASPYGSVAAVVAPNPGMAGRLAVPAGLPLAPAAAHTAASSSNVASVSTAQAAAPAIHVSLTIAANTLRAERLLGEGAFGKVSFGTWEDITDVAIKELKISGLPDVIKKEFTHEAQLMANLRSPRIVQLYGVCFEAPLRLVMEYMPKGSLFHLLHSEIDIQWSQRIRIALDTAEGLQFLHIKDPVILHRDLKSLNVLLDINYRAKLTDFGLAQIKQVISSTSEPHSKPANSVGTIAWMAPELFARKPDYSTASDVYAYGMVLWEIASRSIPFKDAANVNLIPTWVEKGEREDIPKETPIKYAALIAQCWGGRKESRPTVKDVITTLKDLANDYGAAETESTRGASHTSQQRTSTASSTSQASLETFAAKNNLASGKTPTTHAEIDSSKLASFAPQHNLASAAGERASSSSSGIMKR